MVASRAAVQSDAPIVIELMARFRLGSRLGAERVAATLRRGHEAAQIAVSRTRLFHPRDGWTVYVRLPETTFGLERVRLLTEEFAELAEEHGGEVQWQATRPRRPHRQRR
jgi:hypothetical protein